jgi:hypothetical protein
MRFLGIKPLRDDLAEGPLSAKETLKYLPAQGMLLSLIFIPSPADAPPDWAFIAYPLLSLAGIYYCYRSNGGSAGRHFAERYLAVGWVVGLRVAVLGIGAAIITHGISLWIFGLNWIQDDRLSLGLEFGALVLIVLVYWRMGIHLSLIAAEQAVEGLTP